MCSNQCYLLLKIRSIPIRAWIIALIFLTAFLSSTLKSNLSIVLSAMVVPETQTKVPYCHRKQNESLWENITDVPDLGPRYDWSTHQKWHVNVAFFYGVAVASIPAGILTEWLGPKKSICFPLFFAGIVNSLSAYGAQWGWNVFFACRFIIGLAVGTLQPAMQGFVGKWAPPNEKGKFINAMMGDSLGTVFIWLIIQYTAPDVGWQWSFYISTVLIFFYCIAFWFLAADSPQQHKRITQDELDYIYKSQKGTVALEQEFPPYCEILNSAECWASAILNFGSRWGVNIQVQMVPIFMRRFMGIDSHEMVILEILPHVARFFGGTFFGNLSDYIRSRKLMQVTTTTKIFVFFSHFVPAFIMMSLGYMKCNIVAAATLLILSNIGAGAAVGANLMNPTDLSPNFASTIFGFNMFLAQSTGFIVPLLGASILNVSSGLVGWTIIFLIGGGAYFSTGVIFVCFGSAEVQPWNRKTGTRLLRRSTVMSTGSA